jgi:hypothetical protein
MDEMQEQEEISGELVFKRSRILLPRKVWIVVFIVVGIPLALLTLGTAFMLFSDPEPWPLLVVLLILDFLLGVPLRAFVVGKVIITPGLITLCKTWEEKTVRLEDVAVVVVEDDTPTPLLSLRNGAGGVLLEFDTYDFARPEELMQVLRGAVPEWRAPKGDNAAGRSGNE